MLAKWVAAVVVAMAAPGQAQEVNCASAGTQNEMTFCAEQDWVAADAGLNAIYQQALAVLQQIDADLPKADRVGANFLRQAQRDWVSFRDNACAAEGWPVQGGSAEPMVIYACRARLTRERSAGLGHIAGHGNEN